jgi:hypothetical protein
MLLSVGTNYILKYMLYGCGVYFTYKALDNNKLSSVCRVVMEGVQICITTALSRTFILKILPAFFSLKEERIYVEQTYGAEASARAVFARNGRDRHVVSYAPREQCVCPGHQQQQCSSPGQSPDHYDVSTRNAGVVEQGPMEACL